MELEQILKEHIKKTDEMLVLHHKALFGDNDLKQQGIKDKVDAMYDILVQVNHIKGFFSVFGSFLRILIFIGVVIGVMKGWFFGLIQYIKQV